MTTTAQPERNDAVGESENKSVLKLLANPRSYPEATRRVERIETHISRVFLTDRFVYKLKKPVQYDFLDFSTAPRRRQACEQEVRLNRRLAREVYLGVVPITKNEHAGLQVGGAGEPVDWLVKMRRLPAERALDQLIRSRNVTKADIHELAVRLSDSYQQLPPLSINVEDYRRRLEAHILANHREQSQVCEQRGAGLQAAGQNSDLPRALLNRVHAAQIRFLRLASDVLDVRVCDGRIVDGHGDLRPEHIYFNPHPTIIDCIEFNDEFRQLDVLDELAFLAAECEHLDAAWIGDRVIEEYRATSGDEFSQTLLDFYKTYRACVRAKVATLRGSQVPEEERHEYLAEARRYLQLADRHAEKLGPPVLLVVYGLSGTGKTTLAQRLAEQLSIDSLGTDTIRRELYGKKVSSADSQAALYQPSQRLRVYDEMFDRAERLLCDRLSVILDGTFPTVSLRQRAAELSRRYAAVPRLVHCHCQAEFALQRIVDRAVAGQSLSDATPAIYERQRSDHEPDPPDLPVCHVETDDGLAAVTHTVFGTLRPLLGLS